MLWRKAKNYFSNTREKTGYFISFVILILRIVSQTTYTYNCISVSVIATACFYDFYDYGKHLGLHTSHFPCLPCCQNPNFLWMAIWPIPEDESWLDYQSEQSISIFLNDGNIYRPLFLLWQIEYKKNLLLWKFVITYKGVPYRENFFVLCLPTWGHCVMTCLELQQTWGIDEGIAKSLSGIKKKYCV